jgi:hypothetical protein
MAPRKGTLSFANSSIFENLQLTWPALVFVGIMIWQFATSGIAFFNVLKVLASYQIPIAGPFVAVGIGAAEKMYITIALLVLTDLIGGAVLWYLFRYTNRFPRVGKYIKKLTKKNQKHLSKHPLAEKFSFLAVTAFMLLPRDIHAGALGAAAVFKIGGVKLWEFQLGVIIADAVKYTALFVGFTGVLTLFNVL